MNVIVCIKQVPGSSIPMGTDGLLERERAGGRLNPWDSYALEAGLRIAEASGGKVTALTMGPESAEEVLRTAFSMGAAEGVLMSHRAFRGADVCATARTLAQGIRCLGNWDVIVCGQQTADGDTAQLPFSLAVQLGIPAVGWVKDLKIRGNTLTAAQELTGGTQEATLTGSCLLAVGSGIGVPRIPSLRDQLRSRGKTVRRLTPEDLADSDPASYGLAASHTRVVRAYDAEEKSKSPILKLSAKAAAEKILALCSRKEESQ